MGMGLDMKRRRNNASQALSQSLPPALRVRAVALPLPMISDDRLLAMIHAVLALLIPLFLLSLVGCDFNDQGPQAVSYGPEVDAVQIGNAIASTWQDSDPTKTQVGAYATFETMDTIAGGTMQILTADTAQKVLGKTDDGKNIIFDLFEYKVNYHQDLSKPETMSREFELAFEKPAAATKAIPSEKDIVQLVLALSKQVKVQEATKPDDPAPAPNAPITFHRLVTFEDQGPPPQAVLDRDPQTCLGIPNCTMRYRHVSFDVVFWHTPQGDRTRVEFISSPDAPQILGWNMTPFRPFYPGLMRTCLTQLIALDDPRNKTLITECQNVRDFAFTDPNPTPSPTPTPTPTPSPTPTPTP
jgi:hypothetical protein